MMQKPILSSLPSLFIHCSQNHITTYMSSSKRRVRKWGQRENERRNSDEAKGTWILKCKPWDAVYSPWATNLAPSSHEKRESWPRSQFRVLSRGSPGGPQQSWNKEPLILSLCTEQIRWDVASKVLNNAHTAGTYPDGKLGYGYTEIALSVDHLQIPQWNLSAILPLCSKILK